MTTTATTRAACPKCEKAEAEVVRLQAVIDRLVIGGQWIAGVNHGLNEHPEYRAFRSALKAAKGEQGA